MSGSLSSSKTHEARQSYIPRHGREALDGQAVDLNLGTLQRYERFREGNECEAIRDRDFGPQPPPDERNERLGAPGNGGVPRGLDRFDSKHPACDAAPFSSARKRRSHERPGAGGGWMRRRGGKIHAPFDAEREP